MNKVKFYTSYPLDVDIDTERSVEVYIDQFNDSPIPPDTMRIIILQEAYNPSVPTAYELFEFVKNRPDCYDVVLTYYEDILTTNSKSRLFMGTTSWVQGYMPPVKKFMVSTVVGGKNNPLFPGYAIRHDLWRNRELIKIPRDFYLSSETRWAEGDYTNDKVLKDSSVLANKSPLFDSQFHIAIENTSIKNMFTEKLIDCFQTKTVPIYCGCTNIGDFFNIGGILVVNNLTDILRICNGLTEESYNRMLPAIEDNYMRSHRYCIYDEQIEEIITKLIND